MEAEASGSSLSPALLGGIAEAGRGWCSSLRRHAAKGNDHGKIFQIELRKVYPLLVAKAELQNK